MKCGFLPKKLYLILSFRFYTFQRKFVCKSAELAKLGISIYFQLRKFLKQSRLFLVKYILGDFQILLYKILGKATRKKKFFLSNFAFCTVECLRARRILRRSNYLKRAVFHLRFSFSKLSASFHESFTKAVHIA